VLAAVKNRFTPIGAWEGVNDDRCIVKHDMDCDQDIESTDANSLVDLARRSSGKVPSIDACLFMNSGVLLTWFAVMVVDVVRRHDHSSV